MANTFRLRIVKADREFEAEGDKKFVLDMLDRFEEDGGNPGQNLKKPKEPASPASNQKQLSDTKKMSVGEFVRQIGLKKHTDLVLAFGYYLEKHSGLTEFTPADINNCYYDAKMESSNTSQMIIRNIRRGFIMESKGEKDSKRKSFVITRTGEQFVVSQIQTSGE